MKVPWQHPSIDSDGDRVPVEFWGGPACGSVMMCPPEELPDNLCRHPRFPDVEYILFKRLADGKLFARFAKG